MNKRLIFLATICALIALVLVACSGAAIPTPAPTQVPTVLPTAAVNSSKPSGKSSSALATKSNSGGSVDVDVTPTALNVGEPITFDVAMNTHSVDLSDDLTKIAILRDDAGKEYKPMAWDGGEAGGHHREGVLKFAALTSKPKYVELVITGLAQVPERVFRWDLP